MWPRYGIFEQGEEICVSYVEPWLGEAERRQRIWAHVGQMCECGRCVREREAAAKGGEADASDVAKIRQDIVDAQMASLMRLAKSGNLSAQEHPS